ncbi:HAD-IC family P-type ATPase [Bifidobacterium sp. ESL0763]|uniref:HAD-IC family P-type ATPase n=1 Tax=Bifidobacterium sp. ESL0763 TaxID=2983227 RepID=UPI0023F7E35D|nr:HAD-IC family P-type ATPase [Bifidobacterium sp. ESL0763]MDF7663179.1 HAD-IC family P-type ATPase [Bifidobacterium sp. ESL0763]
MRVIAKIAGLCRQVPMLPITIVAVLPVALLWNYRPWNPLGSWSESPWPLDPSVGQIVVVLLVAYSVIDSIRGMVASLKEGHVGIDVLAILALLSTLWVQEYWAAWAVVLMIWSGEAIERFAQTKAEGNLSALVAAAPQMAHVSDLPGVRAGEFGDTVQAAGSAEASDGGDDEASHARRDEDESNTHGGNDAGEKSGNADFSDRPANLDVSNTSGVPSNPDGSGGSDGFDDSDTLNDADDSEASDAFNASGASNDSNTSNASNASGEARLALLFAGTDKRLADGFRATLPPTLPRADARALGDNLCMVDADDCTCELASVARDGGAHGVGNNGADSRNQKRSRKASPLRAGSLGRHTFVGGSLARASQASRTMEPQASRDAHFHTVPVDQVRLGDVLVVLPGETVPVDGKLLSGTATLDLSAINGEPLPRTVFAGARVMSGAVNGSTMVMIRATQLAGDSQYQRTMQLVDSARSSRAPVVKTADVLAVPFTIISLIIGIAAWVVSGTPERFAQVLVLATPCPLLIAAPVAYMAGTGRLAKAGILAKTQEVLENLGKVSHVFFDKTGTLTVTRPQVVRVDVPDGARESLPEALGLESDAHEPASSARLEATILELAAVVETYSVHILAQGIVAAGAAASKKLHDGHTAFPVVKDVDENAGNGVQGTVEGHTVRVGRLGYALEGHSDDVAGVGAGASDLASTRSQKADGNGHRHGVGIDAHRTSAPAAGDARLIDGVGSAAAGDTDVSAADSADALFPASRFKARAADEMAAYVAVDGVLAARIVLRDVPRGNARESLRRLRSMGVDEVTMVTGDSRDSAEVIAAEVGIDDVRADLLPQDKVAAVKEASHETLRRPAKVETFLDALSGQPRPRPISVMVGDGVNDAPVLAAADIGIAMTDGTSTAASQTAQVVIMNDDIADVPRAIAIARQTKRTMLQAVVTGLGLALVCMVAAAFDLIPVVVGAFMQEGIDVVSILWALTALRERDGQ